jgi:DNA repair protein RadA/Sms
MAKTRSKYVCSNCGRQTPAYMGRCPQCGEFSTMQEVVEEVRKTGAKKQDRRPVGIAPAQPQRLHEVTSEAEERLRIPVEEFNRVMGGGIVPGSITLIGGEPGVGKCVTGGTRLIDPDSGAYLSITEWEKQNRPVLAVDDTTLCLELAQPSAFFRQGVKPVCKVQTKMGRTLRCTPSHPVLTPHGWQPVEELGEGSRIASPRTLPYFGNTEMPESQVKLIAYILSDGSAKSQISVTNMQPEVEFDMLEIARNFGMRLRIYQKKNSRAKQYRFVKNHRNMQCVRDKFAAKLHEVKHETGISWAEWARQANVSYGLLNCWQRGGAVPNEGALQRMAEALNLPVTALGPDLRNQAEGVTPIARFLESVGLRFSSAATKAIPDCVFMLPRKQLSMFLKILFTCDGSVYLVNKVRPGISYSSISRRLAEDVQHLLLRFGFVARLRTKPSQVNGEPYVSYELQLLGIPHVQRFLEEIGIFGREEACAEIMQMRAPELPSTHFDTIPTGESFWNNVYETCGTTFVDISRQIGTKFQNRRHDRPLTRYTVEKLADGYPLSSYFQSLAYGDVYWDEIIDITPDGEAEVFDISVPGLANFVANDLIVHNSTLLLQVSALMANEIGDVLYVSGEESARQLKMRADRLGLEAPDLFLLTETNLGNIFEQVRQIDPNILIIDSIQTTYSEDLDSSPGLVSQVRECASRLQTLAKSTGISVFLVGHVTKDGNIAGPRVLEHIVDTVLYLEGDPFQAFRLLRGVKNRFGATSEVGVFEMQSRGMVEVPNPSEAFLAERVIDSPGSGIVVTMEGTRPLLVEMQALTSMTSFGNPRRTPNGVDINRLLLITAVLNKRVGLKLHDQDIFVNVIGGLKVGEPASDLAMAMAIASSYLDRLIPADLVMMGEVGLSGEVRAVSQLAARLNEAAKIGFKRALVPKMRRKVDDLPDGLKLHYVRNLAEALNVAVPK